MGLPFKEVVPEVDRDGDGVVIEGWHQQGLQGAVGAEEVRIGDWPGVSEIGETEEPMLAYIPGWGGWLEGERQRAKMIDMVASIQRL